MKSGVANDVCVDVSLVKVPLTVEVALTCWIAQIEPMCPVSKIDALAVRVMLPVIPLGVIVVSVSFSGRKGPVSNKTSSRVHAL